MAKIQKALDLNKLKEQQAKGKLLKKHLTYPMIAQVKYDGNYTAIKVQNGTPTFITTTSELHTYTHTDDAGSIFIGIPDGVYFAERVYKEGKLGDRTKCNLTGSANDRKSSRHTYRVFDLVSLEDYDRGHSSLTYQQRWFDVTTVFGTDKIARTIEVFSEEEAEEWLQTIVKQGYEGIMLKNPDAKWKDTKSRTVDVVKWKKRPTVDLLCVGVTEGTGKYEGMIGSLVLEDSNGRQVSVGSGFSDMDRASSPDRFIGQVVEMFYEHIGVNTYIQPTFGSEYEGVLIRHDKTFMEID